jgi:SRSO17 transposase
MGRGIGRREVIAMDGRSLARLKRELGEFAGELLVDLRRRDQRAWAVAYLRGLLLDGDRKSVGPMAARLAAVDHEPAGSRRGYEQALQQFVGQSTWPAEAVRDRLQRWLAARGRRRAAAADLLILDDTGFPKQGTASVGVARQYTGTPGKEASCQVAVTLQHARQPAADTAAAGGEVFRVDARLYLPERGWCDDRPRLDRVGVPPDVGYQPKWRIALDMLGRARANGLGGTVLADSLFGTVTAFRRGLDEQGWAWCVGVDSTVAVIDAAEDLGAVPPWSGNGRPPTRPARVAARVAGVPVKRWAADRAADFRTVNWRDGSRAENGRPRKLGGRFAAWRVRPAHRLSDGTAPLAACWLLAEWAGRGGRADQVLLRQPAGDDVAAGAGAGGEGPVVGGAELPGDEGRAGAGPLRGPRLGRVAPPRGAGDARVRVRRRPAAAKRGRRDRPRVSVPQARRLMQELLLCWAGWCPVCHRRISTKHPASRPEKVDTS